MRLFFANKIMVLLLDKVSVKGGDM
jgi:hypothetical protein